MCDPCLAEVYKFQQGLQMQAQSEHVQREDRHAFFSNPNECYKPIQFNENIAENFN